MGTRYIIICVNEFCRRFTMIRKVFLILGITQCVLADGHHAISEQSIKSIYKEHTKQHSQEHSKESYRQHGELSHLGSKEPEDHDEYAWTYPSYEFSYKVHDPHTHDIKGQQETRDGDEVKGEYWLIEPDGRKRVVTYNADKHDGFHALVHYTDDHHHIRDEDKKEENGKEEESNEDKKVEEVKEEEKEHEKQETVPIEEEKAEKVHHDKEDHVPREEVGKWIHDHHYNQGKLHKYNRYEEHKHSHHYRSGPNEFKNLGNRGQDDDDKEYRIKEESQMPPVQRPVYRSGVVVRENYFHPRLYRQNKPKTIGL